jgi:hypothetical protein
VDDLQRITVHLHDLARNKPTPKQRAEVEALLQHKWEGVQVSAAQVLATWGGPESVSALLRWLNEERSNEREAVKALSRCVGDGDIGWALDLYFDNPGFGLLFWPLVIALPRKPALQGLRTEAKAGSPNREAAKIALTWIAQHDQWLEEQSQGEGKNRR